MSSLHTRVVEHYSGPEPYWQVEYRGWFGGWRVVRDSFRHPRYFAHREAAVRVAEVMATTGHVPHAVVWDSTGGARP